MFFLASDSHREMLSSEAEIPTVTFASVLVPYRRSRYT